jgi:hypothetical protein
VGGEARQKGDDEIKNRVLEIKTVSTFAEI